MLSLLLAAGLVAAFALLMLSAVSKRFEFGHSGDSPPLSDSVDATGEHAAESNIALAGGTTDQQEAIAFSHTGLRGIYIKTDQDVTLETNAADATGGQTFTLKAGIPFVWVYNSGIANPFSAAVTTTFWTNAGATAANIYVRRVVA